MLAMVSCDCTKAVRSLSDAAEMNRLAGVPKPCGTRNPSVSGGCPTKYQTRGRCDGENTTTQCSMALALALNPEAKLGWLGFKGPLLPRPSMLAGVAITPARKKSSGTASASFCTDLSERLRVHWATWVVATTQVAEKKPASAGSQRLRTSPSMSHLCRTFGKVRGDRRKCLKPN